MAMHSNAQLQPPADWRWLLLASFLAMGLWAPIATAQDSSTPSTRLAQRNFKSGEETLRAFEPISRMTRHSVVKVDLNGTTVALAAVIDSSGLAITKASEIKDGKLTCWLASGKEVDAELIRT